MEPLARLGAVAQDGVISLERAFAFGLDPAGVSRLARRGLLTRLHKGFYAMTAEIPADASGRHQLHARAVQAAYRRTVAPSHHTAAILHGLPTFGGDLSTVRMVRLGAGRTTSRAGSGGRPGLAITDRVPQELIMDGRFGPLCSPAAAGCQIAMLSGVEAAVVSLDAALNRRLCTPEHLRSALLALGSRPGSAAARTAVGLADGRAESPGESRLRVRLRALGYAVEPQVVLRLHGRFVARADLYLRERRIVIEFDGAVKYRTDSGNDGRFELRNEKRREDELRDLGCQVVRFGWTDLDRDDVLRDRLERAVQRSRRLA